MRPEQIWLHCRWPDPADPADLQAMSGRLAAAQQEHPELRRCTIDRLRQV